MVFLSTLCTNILPKFELKWLKIRCTRTFNVHPILENILSRKGAKEVQRRSSGWMRLYQQGMKVITCGLQTNGSTYFITIVLKSWPDKMSNTKVKNDHCSKFSNLSNWKEEAWKNQGFNGIRTRDLRDTGAMLYQLSYEATHWERGQFIEFISPVRSQMMWSIYEIIHIIIWTAVVDQSEEWSSQ